MTMELRGTRRKEMQMNVTGTTTGVAARRAAEKDRPTLRVTTDGSDVALHAAELAVGLSGLLGAKLHVLYVLDEDMAFRTGIHYGAAVRDLAVSGWRATDEVTSLAEGPAWSTKRSSWWALPRGRYLRSPMTSAPTTS